MEEILVDEVEETGGLTEGRVGAFEPFGGGAGGGGGEVGEDGGEEVQDGGFFEGEGGLRGRAVGEGVVPDEYGGLLAWSLHRS